MVEDLTDVVCDQFGNTHVLISRPCSHQPSSSQASSSPPSQCCFHCSKAKASSSFSSTILLDCAPVAAVPLLSHHICTLSSHLFVCGHALLVLLPPSLSLCVFVCVSVLYYTIQAFETALVEGLLWRHDVDWAVFNTGLRRARPRDEQQVLFLSRRMWSLSGGVRTDPVSAPWVASSKVCDTAVQQEGGPTHLHTQAGTHL